MGIQCLHFKPFSKVFLGLSNPFSRASAKAFDFAFSVLSARASASPSARLQQGFDFAFSKRRVYARRGWREIEGLSKIFPPETLKNGHLMPISNG
jgi:hypothetical protein